MFVALDQTADLIPAWMADDGPFTCPACRAAVLLKRGPIVAAHFAHRPESICSLATGEGDRHRIMKWQLGTRFGLDAVRFEVAFGTERRADLVNGRIVVECQASPLSVDEWEGRTRFYNERGYPVLWVWDMDRLGPEGAIGEHRVPAELRHCHRMSYGQVVLLDGSGALFAGHFDRVIRESEFQGEVFERTLKSTKFVSLVAITRSSIRQKTGPSGHLIGDLGVWPWWKGQG